MLNINYLSKVQPHFLTQVINSKTVNYTSSLEHNTKKQKKKNRYNITLHQLLYVYPNKSSDDLYNSCSCCSILDLWSWDTCILKDVICIKPDL